MVGATVDLHPALAKEVVQRGHEACGHGQTCAAQYSMTPEQERESYKQSVTSIERATGTRPLGFNAFWLRGTPHTLEILQELGFIYHIDDVSRDEPFLINVKGKPFAVLLTSFGVKPVCAQTPATPVDVPTPAGWPKPAEDNRVLTYVIGDQLEGRTNGLNTSFRWDGEGWIGTDFNKLWIKSEGRVMNGVTSDGDHEFLYDRPTPHLRYFDWQAGVSISIPVQLAHGPQSAYRDLLRTSSILRQRCMFAMEDGSREESQARTICTSLNG